MATPTDVITLAQLRFLAEAAITVLSSPEEQAAQREPLSRSGYLVPPDASESMLRALLERAIPVLEAASRHDLVVEIRRVLDR